MTSQPSARRLQVDDAGETLDLRAADAGGLGIGVGDAGGIDVTLHGIPEGAEEAFLVEKGMKLLRLLHGDELGFEAQHPRLALGHLQEVQPGGRVRQHEAARHVDAAGLAGNRLDLLVEVDGVGLQLGDVGIAVQGVHAAGGVPGRPRGQFAALQQHHVAPAGLGQVVKHAAADDPAADHHHLGMRLHGLRLPVITGLPDFCQQ
jgi:hypothetical protein